MGVGGAGGGAGEQQPGGERSLLRSATPRLLHLYSTDIYATLHGAGGGGGGGVPGLTGPLGSPLNGGQGIQLT